jgi:hypothetical protein
MSLWKPAPSTETVVPPSDDEMEDEIEVMASAADSLMKQKPELVKSTPLLLTSTLIFPGSNVGGSTHSTSDEDLHTAAAFR